MLYQCTTRERLNHAAPAVVLEERVVLLGCGVGERLEPVGDVGNAVLECPRLHALCYGVSRFGIERCIAILRRLKRGIRRCVKIAAHLIADEHQFAEVV